MRGLGRNSYFWWKVLGGLKVDEPGQTVTHTYTGCVCVLVKQSKTEAGVDFFCV